MSIQYIPYKQIDKEKWDRCIASASNGLIYGTTLYLDYMADNWDGLVLNDYEAVMPLTWRKKFGIRYLYQPAFTQQLGIFRREPSDAEMLLEFILAASTFRFAEIALNYGNTINLPEAALAMKNNYVLPLDSPYNELYNQYNPDIKESLSRVKKFSLQYEISDDHVEAIDLYTIMYGNRMSFSGNDKTNFIRLCDALKLKEQLIIRKVNTKHYDNLAVALLLKAGNRLYNIISYTSRQGRSMLANYFMYDNIIQEFAEQKFILDFEGSDVEGIAYFYSKFTSINQQYPFLKWNNLPWIVKLFKH